VATKELVAGEICCGNAKEFWKQPSRANFIGIELTVEKGGEGRPASLWDVKKIDWILHFVSPSLEKIGPVRFTTKASRPITQDPTPASYGKAGGRSVTGGARCTPE
jgi:hypothetical protein